MRNILRGIVITVSVMMVIFSVAACGSEKEQSSDWPTTGLGAMLPQPEKGKLDITFDWDDRFYATVEKTDKDTYRKYVDACKEAGFTIEAEEKDSSNSSYSAYNSDGYKLELRMYRDDEFTVNILAPEELDTIAWPTAGPATYIPEPKSKTGKINIDTSDEFSVMIGETTKDDYDEYVGWCFDYGYNIDYENSDDHYSAYNYYGVLIEVAYEGNNIMSISVEVTEETTAEQENVETETYAPETADFETSVSETEAQADSNSIRPEIKEAIDSYEAFIDEYCEFMNNYNASDLTLLAKYTELLAKEIEMTKQFDDIANKDLNDAETAYFTEVELRCAQKMNEAAVNMAH